MPKDVMVGSIPAGLLRPGVYFTPADGRMGGEGFVFQCLDRRGIKVKAKRGSVVAVRTRTGKIHTIGPFRWVQVVRL